ncbi:hypothetical protein [Streptomyces halstedii]|uniref:hypothetical protein n=1 Tax=Streptomyces halstedii TaxID=1944 RepID=UPI00334EAFBE
MRALGINYDTGFTSAGTTTHEPFDPAAVRREMRVIRDELRCDAVRVTGGDPDRLETAARHAAEAGLEVWYSPFTNGLSPDALLSFLSDSADRAEKLRRTGADVTFLTGSEISLFTTGFLPGDTYTERQSLFADPQRLRDALPGLPARINAFLAEAVAAVRARFHGRVGYASLPFEGVDWAPFDVVATDAGYRDASTADLLESGLRALVSHGKPAAVTEFGCAPYRGAADIASRADQVVAWDGRGRPAGFTRPVVRDEQEQADYLRELLGVYGKSGLDAAFVYTFARYDLPHDGTDDARDFDKASYGIVRVLPPGRTGTTRHPGPSWEPKTAFHTLAAYGRDRDRSPRTGPVPAG